ncbi:hypothetical protein vseg_000081 [Gypsophila vaccaria]
MSWSSDWMCGACQHMNFKRRDSCHRCGYSRYGGPLLVNNASSAATNNTTTEVALPGDWYCQAFGCGAHNYASRVSCFRCSALKPRCHGAFFGGSSIMTATGEGVAVIPGWKTGDWICSRCGEHNYACRVGCYKCKTPRDCGHWF